MHNTTPSIAQILMDARLGDLRYVLAEEREPYDPFGAVGELFRLFEERKIGYVLVGGVAMLQYVEGRNTCHIDLIMSPEDLRRMPEFEVLSQDADFARASFQGVEIELLLTTNKVFELVRCEHTDVREFAERNVVCATVSGMLILKLFAIPSLYRQGDFARASVYEADIRALAELEGANMGSAVEALRPHMLPSDIEELRRLIGDLLHRGDGFRGD